MSVTPNALLDQAPGVGQIASSVRFDVLSRGLDVIGTVTPDAAGIAITNDSHANIYRALRGITLHRDDVSAINLFSDRLRPCWVLEDGSGPADNGWPLGVFMFSARDRVRGSLHSLHQATLLDQLFQLDTILDRSFGLPGHARVREPIIDLIEEAGIFAYDIAETDATIGEVPILWPPARTSRLAVLRELAVYASWAPPYFDNAGRLVLGPLPPLVPGGGHAYPTEGVTRIADGTAVESDNLLDAPNVYVVVGSGAGSTEIVATATIDPRLPHSIENIGYRRPRVITLQGLVDSAQAEQIAQNYAADDPAQLDRVTFTGAPDPRHDTFDVVEYGDRLYREARWELACSPGGTHSHSLVRQIFDPSTGGVL